MDEPNGTRGLSQRELILILIQDVRDLKRASSKRPTRLELYGTIGAVVALVTSILAFGG